MSFQTANCYKNAFPKLPPYPIINQHAMATGSDKLTNEFSFYTFEGDIIDYRTELLIFGFTHELDPKNRTISIPNIIFHLIIKYYHIAEYFAENGPWIDINDIYDTIQHGGVPDDPAYMFPNTCYGHIEFDMYSLFIYEWTFKIIDTQWGITIGIDCSDRQFRNTSFTLGGSFPYDHPLYTTMYYAISNGGCQYSHELPLHYLHMKIPERFMESKGFGVDDIVTMRMDVPNQKITYYVGGYDDRLMHFSQRVEFGSPAVKYCMAVALGYPGCGVKLIRFKKMLSKTE